MKYLTYELICSVNEWTDPPTEEPASAHARFAAAVDAYHRELDDLRPRISGQAWRFFRYGSGETGLHDARLLSLDLGDGLGFAATGAEPFRLNRQRAAARATLLNFEQTSLHTFDCRGLVAARVELARCEDSAVGAFGDLYTHELTDGGDDRLALGLLFADGHEVQLTFERLVYRRRALRPEYDLREIYR